MLSVSALTKVFDNGHQALHNLALDVSESDIVGIVGGSGCGKSTLLRLIAGLETPSGGTVLLDGRRVDGPRAEIGMVFQEPRLMPWLTIEQNLAFGIRHLQADDRRQRVAEALARVGLAEFARHWPRELSGGMAQRVALARALVGRPAVLLLDEPFSALDALTRLDLQEHLLDLWAFYRPTMILVTHDIEEALVLSDRVLVMRGNPGRIQTAVSPHLPRPRDRASGEFQEWKTRLLAEMHRSLRAAAPGDEVYPAAAI
jgi:sulfonate transport system ATP-binding protein